MTTRTKTGEGVVFVVDDDASVLRSLERLLRLHGIAHRAYDSPSKFLDEWNAAVPGCVLLDLSFPDVSGLEIQQRLMAAGGSQPVIFLTGRGTVDASVRAMKAGAADFLEKPFDNDTVLAAIQGAFELDRRRRARRSSTDAITGRLASLTPREKEVLRYVIAGRLNKQIAARLGTAVKTVKVHRARVMHKMSVRSVAELTQMTIAVGIQPEP